MNTAQTKLIAWTAAGALGVGLSLYVGSFVARLSKISEPVSSERMQKVLSDAPAITKQAEEIVEYKVVERAVIKLNWTGKPKTTAVAVEKPPEPPKPEARPMKDMLSVLSLTVDSSQPEKGKTFLRYKPEARVTLPAAAAAPGQSAGVLKMPGDKLDPPLDSVTVAAIKAEGVEFAFLDENRAHETVPTEEYRLPGQVVQVDGDAVQAPEVQPIPRSSTPYVIPAKTEQLSPNRFLVGTDDAAYLGENYAQVLSEEVRYARHRDPKTGKYDGIEVQDVHPNSIATRHGVQAGDVIKSINGHPVTSPQEAINFVKNNKDLYDTWEVEVMNRGQSRTITYQVPPGT